jgi:hypothetical protein
MLDTFKAILKGNQIEWIDDLPSLEVQDQEVEVLITVLSEMKAHPEWQTQRGERMAQCLEKIANTGGIQGITDPVAWQREIRKERSIYPENHHDS